MAARLWLKRCPRCGGDLLLEQDAYGKYMACLQCGGSVDIDERRELVGVTPTPLTGQIRPGRGSVARVA